MWWGWEKNLERKTNTKANKKKRKKFPVWLPAHPRLYDMEADSFPVSENTKNKPDRPSVGGVPNLMGQKKKAQ